MKIAILGSSDTVHIQRLVQAFVQRGHDVHVLSMKPFPIPGATFERFKVPPFGWRYPYRWRRRWTAYMRDLFRRFDVISVHFLSDWGITESVAAEGCLVVKAYGSDVDHPPDTPPPGVELIEARRSLLQCADRVVAPSRWFREKVAAYGAIDPAKIDVLPFGVDTERFTPACRLTGWKAGPTRVVGFCKGFEPVYAPLSFIEAASRVLVACPDVRFELVGEGSLRQTCRERAESLGIGHAMRWIDFLPHEDLPGIMSSWDVVAITSVKESFCVTAIEAAAMELPVVATDVGGLRESVEHGRTGLLVEPGKPHLIADGLVTLLNDSARRREMGACARRRVAERYQWQHCVDRWIDIFKTVRAQRNSMRRRESRITAGNPIGTLLNVSGDR
ncbi:MAG: glycosyltransferase family 4 protein [Phycisphaerae bacterium]